MPETNKVMTVREEQAGWSVLALFGVLNNFGIHSASAFLWSSPFGPHVVLKYLPPDLDD